MRRSRLGAPSLATPAPAGGAPSRRATGSLLGVADHGTAALDLGFFACRTSHRRRPPVPAAPSPPGGQRSNQHTCSHGHTPKPPAQQVGRQQQQHPPAAALARGQRARLEQRRQLCAQRVERQAHHVCVAPLQPPHERARQPLDAVRACLAKGLPCGAATRVRCVCLCVGGGPARSSPQARGMRIKLQPVHASPHPPSMLCSHPTQCTLQCCPRSALQTQPQWSQRTSAACHRRLRAREGQAAKDGVGRGACARSAVGRARLLRTGAR